MPADHSIAVDDDVRSKETGPGRPIHISVLEIPVSYEAVLAVVPGLHARPPILPEHGGPFFPPPPPSGYDFVFHIGVAGRGPLRMERQGHKLGYQMKDADGKLAPAARSSPKDFSRRPDGPSLAENIERERLGLDMVEIIGDTSIRPSRGFGAAYENFPEEIMTEIDVTRLVQDLRQSGIEVRDACALLTLLSYYPIYSKYIVAWTPGITYAISSTFAHWLRPNAVQSPTRNAETHKCYSCTAHP